MSTERERAPTVAISDAYRRVGLAERIAAGIGNTLGDGALRRALRALYRGALSARTGGRGIECRLPGGESVRLHPAFRFATWHPAEYAAFRAELRAGDVAMDVGANVGAYTLLFAQWVAPGGRVVAFEPSPAAYDGLIRHVALNGFARIVTTSDHAVSDRPGVMTLRDERVNGTTRQWLPGDPSSSRLEVPATTLDVYCHEHALEPRLIKIDVEGAELAVLRGAREVIRAGGSRLALFVELHPTVWAAAGQQRAELLDELSLQGLRMEPLHPGADPWTVEGVCVRLVPS